jgi:cytochrome c oxidase subunit IV
VIGMAEIIAPRIYYRVFATLLVLTLLTWWTSRLHLGSALNIIVALTIALSKALLVTLFFMHVRYSSWLTWVFVGAGMAFLGHLIILTMCDYLTRVVVTGW